MCGKVVVRAPAGSVEVNTGTATGVGTALVDGTGLTLYELETESGGQIMCTGACRVAWPPLLLPVGVTTATPGTGVTGTLGTITRPDGGRQVTYDGRPLYLYSGDQSPGQANGQGIQGVWFAMTPSGPSGGGNPTPAAIPNRIRGGPKNPIGAGDGNRTRIASLEGWNSAIELHPRCSGPQRSNCDTARRGGLVPARRRVHARPVRGEPALRRAGSARRAGPDDHADARARDRLVRDDVRDRRAGWRLRRPDLHARCGTAVRRTPDARHGLHPRVGGSRRSTCRADVGGGRRAGGGRPGGRHGVDGAAPAVVR